MTSLFFKTKDGILINLSEYEMIFADENGDTILQRSAFDTHVLEQPLSDIENFLLKIQGAL